MDLKNVLLMGYGALRANLWRKKLPLNVILSVTNRCPSRCGYCGIPARNQNELTTAQIFSLIDQISRMGCQRLGLWGGEPLIREDIGAIINYAKAKRLFVTLDSNGYFVPQKMKALDKLDHLVLALDGPQQIHDLNREPGSFEKTMAAIDSASGKIPLWTITVLTKHNIDSVDFIIAKAREYGFLTTFQLLHHNDRLSRNQEAFMPSESSCRSCIAKIIKAKKKGAPIASSMKYLRHILSWSDYKEAVHQGASGGLNCWAGRLYCNVDTDGSVYPCSLFIDKANSLNFLDMGFKKAFESLKIDSCGKCLASCFTEYNYLYSLDMGVVMQWVNSMRKTSRSLCKAKAK